jgi:hypothetical protein
MLPIPREPRDRFTWQRASDASWNQKSVPLLFIAVAMIAGSVALAATLGTLAGVGFFFGVPVVLGVAVTAIRQRQTRKHWSPPEDFDSAIATWRYAEAVGLIHSRLRQDERVLGIARASTGHVTAGILVATSDRVIYAREQVQGDTGYISLPYSRVRDVSVQDAPHQRTGTLVLATDDGALTFSLVSPKPKTWVLYWRIAERIGKLPRPAG